MKHYLAPLYLALPLPYSAILMLCAAINDYTIPLLYLTQQNKAEQHHTLALRGFFIYIGKSNVAESFLLFFGEKFSPAVIIGVSETALIYLNPAVFLWIVLSYDKLAQVKVVGVIAPVPLTLWVYISIFTV